MFFIRMFLLVSGATGQGNPRCLDLKMRMCRGWSIMRAAARRGGSVGVEESPVSTALVLRDHGRSGVDPHGDDRCAVFVRGRNSRCAESECDVGRVARCHAAARRTGAQAGSCDRPDGRYSACRNHRQSCRSGVFHAQSGRASRPQAQFRSLHRRAERQCGGGRIFRLCPEAAPLSGHGRGGQAGHGGVYADSGVFLPVRTVPALASRSAELAGLADG